MKGLLHLMRMHWKPLLLVLIVLLLVPALVAALMAAEDEPPTPVPEASAPVEPAAVPAAQEQSQPAAETGGAAPFAEYREMIERPLFSSTRRPPVIRDAPQENLDGQQLREVWRLTGIALEQGRQLASFRERQGERFALLEVGMLLTDDWRLESIGTDHVLLGNGLGEVRMPLREPVTAEESAARAQAKQAREARRQKNKTAAPAQPAEPTDTAAPPPTPVVPETAEQG